MATPPAQPGSSEGDEPDPRWSLANERTMLAYERTALGLLVAGFALAGSHTFTDTPAWVAAIGLPLIAMGALVGLEGRSRYLSADRAMRNGDPLHPPRAAGYIPWGIAAVGLVGLVLAALQLFLAD